MKDPIKLLKMSWRVAGVTLVASSLAFGGLFLSLKTAFAGDPNLTLLYLGVNNSDAGSSWNHSVTVNQGQQVKFYAEIHNTNVPSTAKNVKIKVTLPGGQFTDGSSTATVSADNAESRSDTVSIHINGGGQLTYVSGSTAMTWDPNGDGVLEYSGTQLTDGITGNGVVLGDQNGCNNYIIQLSFKANVSGVAPSPSPSPSPTVNPSPLPSPTVVPSPNPTPCTNCGGDTIVNNNTNNNNNENKQENNQSVNVTQSVTQSPTVTTTAVPTTSPQTGVGVLGLTSMFGAGPLGLAFARYGRGRTFIKGEEENLGEMANEIVKKRRGKNIA